MFSFEIQSRKEIHVTNISARNAIDEEEIIDVFSKFGTIELDRSFKKKFSLRKVSETSLCAWITYTHEGSVKEAVQEMDGKLFDGKYLKVSPGSASLVVRLGVSSLPGDQLTVREQKRTSRVISSRT